MARCIHPPQELAPRVQDVEYLVLAAAAGQQAWSPRSSTPWSRKRWTTADWTSDAVPWEEEARCGWRSGAGSPTCWQRAKGHWRQWGWPARVVWGGGADTRGRRLLARGWRCR